MILKDAVDLRRRRRGGFTREVGFGRVLVEGVPGLGPLAPGMLKD